MPKHFATYFFDDLKRGICHFKNAMGRIKSVKISDTPQGALSASRQFTLCAVILTPCMEQGRQTMQSSEVVENPPQ